MAVVHLWQHFVALTALLHLGGTIFSTLVLFQTDLVIDHPTSTLMWIVSAFGLSIAYFLITIGIYAIGRIHDASKPDPTVSHAFLSMRITRFIRTLEIAIAVTSIYMFYFLATIAVGTWEEKAVDLCIAAIIVLIINTAHLGVAFWDTNKGKIRAPDEETPSVRRQYYNYNTV